MPEKIKKCPYCFEVIEGRTPKCPHCNQYMIDEPFEVDFESLDKKKCFFCGKKVLTEARVCKYCHKWLDAIDQAMNDLDGME